MIYNIQKPIFKNQRTGLKALRIFKRFFKWHYHWKLYKKKYQLYYTL